MVGEVLNDGDAADLGADFKAALDAFEGGEGFDDGFFADALAGGERGGGGGVERVVLAGEVHLELGPRGAIVKDLPSRAAVFVAQIADAPVGAVAEAVALDAAEGVADAFGHVFAAVVGHDEAAARDEIDEKLEGGLDGFEIGVDVGVVELDVGEE